MCCGAAGPSSRRDPRTTANHALVSAHGTCSTLTPHRGVDAARVAAEVQRHTSDRDAAIGVAVEPAPFRHTSEQHARCTSALHRRPVPPRRTSCRTHGFLLASGVRETASMGHRRLAVFATDAVTRYNTQFCINGLHNAMLSRWQLGIPSTMSHDALRPIGWACASPLS